MFSLPRPSPPDEGLLAHRRSNAEPDADGAVNRKEYLFATSPKSLDTEGDQMPDAWEVENVLNPLGDNLAEDVDEDGLANLTEYLKATDPNDGDTVGDGLLEGDEIHSHNTDPLITDTDGDGKKDMGEVPAGTDPHRRGDHFPDHRSRLYPGWRGGAKGCCSRQNVPVRRQFRSQRLASARCGHKSRRF